MPASHSRLRCVEWLAFAALLVAEFLLFDQVGAKHYTWIYPRWNDQIQYLSEAYTGFEYSRAQGLAAGLWHTLVNPTAQGTLHDFWAVLVFQVAGPSRSAALAVNLLAFLAWQAAWFFAVRRVFGSRALAWTSAGLLLALASPWSGIQGSTTDFRLDWLAVCALGVTLAAALLTAGFRHRGWAVAFGAAVGVTLLTRFLTGTYFVLIFAALLLWTVTGSQRGRRTVNLLIAAATALILAGPLMWLSRDEIFHYYWIGHFIGPESAIRNQHMGLGRSVAWLIERLACDHLGLLWLWAVGLATLALLVLAFWPRPSRPAAPPGNSASWFLAATFWLAPALVLVLHQQKSWVVVGILLPGVVLLVLAAWNTLGASLPSWVRAALAVFSLGLGGSFFVQRMLANPHTPGFLVDARKVATLADTIFDRARAAGLAQPRVGTDHITDCLDGQVLRVICYERKHVWVSFDMTLPISIAEAPETDIMERLARSDFVFLSDAGYVGIYPYDRQMRALHPRLRAWCDEHLRLVDQFQLFGRSMMLYQRREIPVLPTHR